VFKDCFGKAIGVSCPRAAALVAPDSIIFSTFKADGEPRLVRLERNNLNVDDEDVALLVAWDYVQPRAAATSPVTEPGPNAKRKQQRIHMQEFYMRVDRRTEAVVRAADAGDPEASVEYALRYASRYFILNLYWPFTNV
jgi:hypothetical protein